MKRRGFTGEGYEFREWDQERHVYVYTTEGVESHNIEKTTDIIAEIIKDFNLPLEVLNGNETKGVDSVLVENLVSINTEEKSIDCERILQELRQSWDLRVLRYGLIVLVNPERYELKSDGFDPEPPIYGWSSNEGLSVLRKFDIQNAVRHEFGHMIGLGRHHPGCAMDWNCLTHEFCQDCRKDIKEIWGL